MMEPILARHSLWETHGEMERERPGRGRLRQQDRRVSWLACKPCGSRVRGIRLQRVRPRRAYVSLRRLPSPSPSMPLPLPWYPSYMQTTCSDPGFVDNANIIETRPPVQKAPNGPSKPWFRTRSRQLEPSGSELRYEWSPVEPTLIF